MGVEATIVLFAPAESPARDAARAAFDRMIALEAIMTDYRVDSELMRLGRAKPGPVAVSDDLFRVLDRARAYSQASDGAFDVTVGPAVSLWRAAGRTGERPDAVALAEARRRIGWRKIALDPRARTVTLEGEDMRLDLGGIGKGFAVDEAVAVLRDAGVTRCLVDLGGDIGAAAPPPGKRGWRIAVATPDPAGPPVVLSLARAAVATSAGSVQHVVVDGVRYSHIVDPRTGLGLTAVRSVTVIAADATAADALASAVSVLGAEAGLPLIERQPAAAALVETRSGGRWTRITSGRFPGGR